MTRLMLAFLLLFLVALLVPDLRVRMQPHIEEGRIWLGEHLEGPMTPVLTPYRRLKTQSLIDEATRRLIRDRNIGQQAPLGPDFRDYLVRREIEPLDAWGAPLLLEQERDSVAIRSPGPDMEYGTEDDLVNKIRYPAPRGRQGPRR
jgi:hypothetical protein